ncbi:hypothetical protein [Aeromonas hydrophila]|uniref:hypothetical protein n=1 Tax=Aeromonas hydrophila TaxID=644 RepID=UPI003D1CAE1C
MLTMRGVINPSIADTYSAGIVALFVYWRHGNYVAAGLVGLVALAAFRIQRLIRRRKQRRGLS